MPAVAEVELYRVVKQFLDQRFQTLVEPPSAIALWRSNITATLAINFPGRWTRPDLAAVHIWRHKFAPAFNVDLHGFEVKASDGCDVTSVFEALAHTRIVHFAHLVWHRPDPAAQTERFKSVAANCRAFGVGFITFEDHEKPDTFTVHQDVPPKRFEPDLALVDTYIEAAFPEHVETISKWLPNFH